VRFTGANVTKALDIAEVDRRVVGGGAPLIA
jgi:hypothetical protein